MDINRKTFILASSDLRIAVIVQILTEKKINTCQQKQIFSPKPFFKNDVFSLTRFLIVFIINSPLFPACSFIISCQMNSFYDMKYECTSLGNILMWEVSVIVEFHEIILIDKRFSRLYSISFWIQIKKVFNT